jgi:hypothetical protein
VEPKKRVAAASIELSTWKQQAGGVCIKYSVGVQVSEVIIMVCRQKNVLFYKGMSNFGKQECRPVLICSKIEL